MRATTLRVTWSVLALAIAALAMTGCGINAQKAVDDAFNVQTDTTGFSAPPPTPTETTPSAADLKGAEAPTQGDIEAGNAIKGSGSGSGSAESDLLPPDTARSSSELPAPTIPLETAEAEARKAASAAAGQQDFSVNPASWDVSCYGDGVNWTCPVSYSSCAGRFDVSKDPGSGAIHATRRDFSCA
jgi:hypothetical protein